MRPFSAPATALVLACAAAALAGCGSTTHGSALQASGGSSGSGDAPGSGGMQPTIQCPAGVPSAAELAATPREFPELELLALKFSSGIVADQVIYDRFVADVTAIHRQAPDLADVTYYPPNDGRSLILQVDASTYDSMQAGTYDAWSCLNDAYGSSDPSFLDFGSFSASFTLRGTYDLAQVGAQYAALPGVMNAEPGVGGRGPTICVTRNGETWHYVVDQASGDCPSGCIDHKYTHFSSSAAGAVTNLGEPSPAELAQYASTEACR